MGCHHEHSHHHKHLSSRKRLSIVFLLTICYMCAEFVGGYFTNSLALIADAGHMLSDAAALGLSVFASWLAAKPASASRTFGYMRAEILAAFINGIFLIGIVLYISYEAYQRLLMPQVVHAPLMIIVASGGLLINIIGVKLLHGSSHSNINIRGALLHIIGDLLGSIGAIIAGLAIYFKGYYIADPIISFVISVLILFSAIRLVINATNILLEASPSHIDVETIRKELLQVSGVKNIHELHVWSVSSENISLSAHALINNNDHDQVLKDILHLLRDKFDIHHATIQIETKEFCEHECHFMED